LGETSDFFSILLISLNKFWHLLGLVSVKISFILEIIGSKIIEAAVKSIFLVIRSNFGCSKLPFITTGNEAPVIEKSLGKLLKT
jgi:hypothetical protein